MSGITPKAYEKQMVEYAMREGFFAQFLPPEPKKRFWLWRLIGKVKGIFISTD